MVVFPYAKINLGLQITDKRQDGYHNIITCFYPLKWCDILEILPAESFSFKNTGLEIPGDDSDNLCIKAYNLLHGDYQLPPVRMHLHKVLPIGAGLGGGSSDASHTILTLMKLFNLPINKQQLLEYARQLGSDCAYFMWGEVVMATGRGDQLESIPLELPHGFLVVVYPSVNVETAEAYGQIEPQPPTYSLKEVLLKYPLTEWKGQLSNQFEPVVLENHPSIKQLRDKLYDIGALYAGLSGSGSSVFAWFEESPQFDSFFEEYTVWCQRV